MNQECEEALVNSSKRRPISIDFLSISFNWRANTKKRYEEKSSQHTRRNERKRLNFKLSYSFIRLIDVEKETDCRFQTSTT